MRIPRLSYCGVRHYIDICTGHTQYQLSQYIYKRNGGHGTHGEATVRNISKNCAQNCTFLVPNYVTRRVGCKLAPKAHGAPLLFSRHTASFLFLRRLTPIKSRSVCDPCRTLRPLIRVILSRNILKSVFDTQSGWVGHNLLNQSKIGIFLKFALCPAKIVVFLKNFPKNMLYPL